MDRQDNRLTSDWVDRAVALERELGREVDWFGCGTTGGVGRSQSSAEETAVRDIYRAVAALALASGGWPQAILFQLAADVPDRGTWAQLLSRSWDRLTASQRASMNGLAAVEKAA